jgi:hypothetical protein
MMTNALIGAFCLWMLVMRGGMTLNEPYSWVLLLEVLAPALAIAAIVWPVASANV